VPDFLIFYYKNQREALPSRVASQDPEVEGEFRQLLAMFDDTQEHVLLMTYCQTSSLYNVSWVTLNIRLAQRIAYIAGKDIFTANKSRQEY